MAISPIPLEFSFWNFLLSLFLTSVYCERTRNYSQVFILFICFHLSASQSPLHNVFFVLIRSFFFIYCVWCYHRWNKVVMCLLIVSMSQIRSAFIVININMLRVNTVSGQRSIASFRCCSSLFYFGDMSCNSPIILYVYFWNTYVSKCWLLKVRC